jgi:hypothetical protein
VVAITGAASHRDLRADPAVTDVTMPGKAASSPNRFGYLDPASGEAPQFHSLVVAKWLP